jgi:hypothetical protein
MSLEIFDALFGSKIRARLIRFFTLNPEGEFLSADIASRTLLSRPGVTTELSRLERLKFVSCHMRRGKKMYAANRDFPFFNELHGLVAKLNVNAQSQVFKRLKLIGEVKMILVSGVFLNYPKAKVDLILVVSHLNRTKLKQALAHLEAEVGKDVRFVLMTMEELQYRLDMLDRFLIEVLEGPYEEVVNKVPEFKRFLAGLRK